MDRDLLPKLKGKVLLTKELAPIFRGRSEQLEENFNILIGVLDGKGFTSDSGMLGRRGYERSVLFNWCGATTPLPPRTHRLMAQLGTRLLFFEVPAIGLTEEDLLQYAAREDSGEAEEECQRAVNEFLVAFFGQHQVGGVPPEEITIPKDVLREIVQLSQLIVRSRVEVRYERDLGEWEPVAVGQCEGPWKVVNALKELARGHALIHGRGEVTEEDLALVRTVALSSTPSHVRPILRELGVTGQVDSVAVARLCGVSRPTARRRLREVALLGLGVLDHGTPENNLPDQISLADEFRWLPKTCSTTLHQHTRERLSNI